MVANRKEDVSRRNITLHPETYERLDKFLFELATKTRNLKTSRDEAINALLDEHYGKRGKD